MPTRSRTDLNNNQIKALQSALDAKGRGKIIDVPDGQAYDDDLETLASVGEELTKRFTRQFSKNSWRVRFLLLESERSNAYAYWMNSFEAVCMTTSLAREIDALCDDVATYLVSHHDERSGFAYLNNVSLSPEVKSASLKGLLIQGVMTFFVGHEIGHLCAGHKPVMTAAAAVAGSEGGRDSEQEFFVDDFIIDASSKDDHPGVHSLRLNAHEVDADVQGIALSAEFWLDLHRGIRSDSNPPPEVELIRAATLRPNQLLLLASTGAVIAMSLMGFKQFDGDWNKQATHPLTAVRCIVGLTVLANRLATAQQKHLTLQLQPECIEALSMVHSRLGSILLRAAQYDGVYSKVAQMLKDALHDERLSVMFRATGMTQAVAKSNDVVMYIAELSAEFNACAPQRANAIRVNKESLVEWTAETPRS